MRRPRPPAVSTHVKWLLGVVVVALLLGGTATAAKKITGSDVADSSLSGKDVRDSSLTGVDIKDRSLSPRDFSESIRGPAGPEGPPGPTGATGRTGASGFALLSQNVGSPQTIAAGTAGTVSALCGPNEIAVSGGYLVTTPTIFTILGSEAGADPATNRDGWTVLALNLDSTAGSVEAIAYCAPLPVSAAAASAASARSRSALGAHQQAWQRLRKAASAMRAAKLTSHR